MTLETARIATRRHELGYSQRALARHLGVTGAVIAAIEDGTNHDQLTLALLRRLADTLALPLPALLADRDTSRPDDHADDGGDGGDVDGDAATLGALLHHADEQRLPRDTAAATLRWDLDRTERAADRLSERLTAAGATLHRDRGDLTVRSATDQLDSDTLRDATRAEHTRRQLPRTAAELLSRALRDGELDTRQLTNNEHVALSRLLHAGILEGEPPRLSRDVTYSLR